MPKTVTIPLEILETLIHHTNSSLDNLQLLMDEAIEGGEDEIAESYLDEIRRGEYALTVVKGV